MNFNIALSTIFYVMIFIFPGIIFRKFYFRGNFTGQFSKGNLFERFTLTMFFSIISVLLSVSILVVSRHLLDIRFLDSISYKTIIDVFNNIKKEQISYEIKNGAIDFLLLMSLIYMISMLSGAVMHSLVIGLRLDIKYPILKFNHPWHYIAKGKNITELRNKEYLYTNIDVLVNDGYKKVMFSGILLDIIQNPQDGKIENIIVKDCKNDDTCEPQNISGNVMCFPMDKVINFNLTHITRDKNYQKGKYMDNVLNTLFVIILLYLCISPWMEKVFWYFEIYGVVKKIIFSISSVLLLSLIFGSISLYEAQKGKKNKSAFPWRSFIPLGVILISTILWTLGFYPWWVGLILYFFIMLIFSLIISYNK